MSIAFNNRYFIYALLLLLVEIFIAMYIRDAIVRPYFGDFLVVILLYCIVRSVLNFQTTPIALAVLLFSYLIETLQYFKIVQILGLDGYPLATTIIGTSFAWCDILAYTLGFLAIIITERGIFK